MVLVFREETEGVMTEVEARHREIRRVFEQNLLKEGLQMELEPKESSFDGKTNFLKLHIPWKVKVQYAEVMNIKLPTKRLITISVKAWVCCLPSFCCIHSIPEFMHFSIIALALKLLYLEKSC